ncbi:hypothetical protein EVAR_13400_1 [Eumeta japonica]|uniref:Uncharacterized protein n=1 Tax=Eumeta variegata TaxID=151549 RepID=A0A4C1V7H9_EUMVA|nr:hypothetical protein EVAR_13400_1 [Eumeta japonica]
MAHPPAKREAAGMRAVTRVAQQRPVVELTKKLGRGPTWKVGCRITHRPSPRRSFFCPPLAKGSSPSSRMLFEGKIL